MAGVSHISEAMAMERPLTLTEQRRPRLRRILKDFRRYQLTTNPIILYHLARRVPRGSMHVSERGSELNVLVRALRGNFGSLETIRPDADQ